MKAKLTFALLPILMMMLAATCLAQEGRVATVDTAAFSDPQRGITRLVKAVQKIDREFDPRRAESVLIQQRLNDQLKKLSFSGPIPTDPEPMTRKRRQQLEAQAEEMRRLVARKQHEAQRAYSKRMEEVTTPIHEEIRRNLETFVEARGITVLLDASKMACLVGCDRESTAAIDVTQEFIAEYNRLNP
jgi:Skp family chaperone for outer membrane proteins